MGKISVLGEDQLTKQHTMPTAIELLEDLIADVEGKLNLGELSLSR